MASFAIASPENCFECDETDWKRCFTCQTTLPKSVSLTNPSKRIGFDRHKPETYGSYVTIANNLEGWSSTSDFPAALRQRISKID